MSDLPSTPTEVHAHQVPIPTHVDTFHFLFSSPPLLHELPNPDSEAIPRQTLDRRDPPPSRAQFLNAATAATLSRQRLHDDALHLALGLREIRGPRVEWQERNPIGTAVHSPRTTVMIHLPNCIPYGPVLLGALRAHSTVCAISSLLTSSELAYVIAKVRPRVIFTSTGPGGKGRLVEAIEHLATRLESEEGIGAFGIAPESRQTSLLRQWMDEWNRDEKSPGSGNLGRIWTVDVAADYYGRTQALGKDDWTHLLDNDLSEHNLATLPPKTIAPREQRERVALLLFSSGTTGLPKGVLLTHRAIISHCVGNLLQPHQVSAWKEGGERWVALAPWCHIFGLSTLLLPGIAQGATIIMPPQGRFNLRGFLELVSIHRATWANIAPPVVVAIRNTPLLDPTSPHYLSHLDLSALKGFMSGGAPVAPEIIVDVWNRMGKYVQMGYGSSETGGTHNGRGLNLSDALSKYAELGSTGTLLVNASMRIRPPQDLSAADREALHRQYLEASCAKRQRGEVAPEDPCIPGEIQIKSESAVMLGYASGLGSDETDEDGRPCLAIDPSLGGFTPDGWYKTGDEGVIDGKGNLWITGRIKETFKVKGFQVAPPELDAIFTKHPQIADVAAGSYYENDEGTDVVVLYVQPKDLGLLSGPHAAQRQKNLVRELHDWVQPLASYYKWPRYYVFTEAIPKSPSGKILRRDLHKIAEHRLPAPRVTGFAKL